MSRRYLSEAEVQRILDIASPHSLRNYCMIYLAFIHGLRVSELISLQLTDYDPLASTLSIRRLKGGLSTIHPLSTEGSRIIRQWLQERSDSSPAENPWFFPSYNNTHITRQRFWQIIRAYGDMAGLTVRAHPHMLRHACGFALAERGNDTRLIQDYLGHKNIRHTVRYTATSPARFRQAWRKPPGETRPRQTLTLTYSSSHIQPRSFTLSPTGLSHSCNEHGKIMKAIRKQLNEIHHILKRMTLRPATG